MLKKLSFLLTALLLVSMIPLKAAALAAPPSLYAQGAILLDADTGQILLGKNMHEKLYPASITKIMTCLLAMEEGDPSDIVTVTDEGVQAVPRDTTHIALTGGEQLTLEQLEYAMMVQSANDAANAIAIHIGGSLDGFVKKMNERAVALGARDTRFSNANGLFDTAHITSAYDMGLFTREAMKHPEFRKLAGTQHYQIPPTNLQKETRFLNNNQYMFTLNDTYPGAFAGKTGWTPETGHTLVTVAEQNGVTLICVVLHADAAGVLDCQYKDSTALLDYGFQNYKRTAIPASVVTPQSVEFRNEAGEPEDATLKPAGDMSVLLPEGYAASDVKAVFRLPETLDSKTAGQARVELTLPGVSGADAVVLGTFSLSLERPHVPAAATADTPQAAPAKLPTWLIWGCLVLAAICIGIFVLRQVLLARYRRRQRMLHLKKKRLQARRRPALTRTAPVVDVTQDKAHKNKIKVVDVRDE